MAEYAGPLIIYLLFYIRPSLIYGSSASSKPIHLAAQLVEFSCRNQIFENCFSLGAACWTFHYAKRIFETIFVHRFSHSTMPILNLFKNCGYYWGFTALVSYFVNHPKYTPPSFGYAQIYLGLAIFIVSLFSIKKNKK
jgi:very-long-chain enoyl-CoA reductase